MQVLANRVARLGVWTLAAGRGSRDWSPELEEIFGVERGSFGGTPGRVPRAGACAGFAAGEAGHWRQPLQRRGILRHLSLQARQRRVALDGRTRPAHLRCYGQAGAPGRGGHRRHGSHPGRERALPAGGHCRVFGRRHHQQDPGWHRHFLERRRRAPVRLQRRGNGRFAHHAIDSRPNCLPRGSRHTGEAATRRTH